jgi:transposase
LERIDLSFVRESYPLQGGVPYEPLDVLGILCLAYFLGITGSGTIAEHCRYDVRFLHVARGRTPDARTLRRFRARLAPHLEEIFRRVVQACKEEGLVGGRRVAVDGTKIASSASQSKRWLSASEREDLEGLGLETQSSDPEARVMKGASGYLLGYNAQAAVDVDSGVVVAVEATDSSADSGSLASMAAQAVRNLGGSDFEVVADAGYDSYEGLRACQALGLTATVAQQGNEGAFWSVVDEAGTIVCPMGRPAEFVRLSSQRGLPVRVLAVTGCPECVFYGACCKSPSGRSLKVPEGCDPAERILAHRHLRSPDGREAMKERMASVEPAFADAKATRGFRRLRMRGKAGARVEWTLVHLARNLKKLGKALGPFLFALLAALGTLARPFGEGRSRETRLRVLAA